MNNWRYPPAAGSSVASTMSTQPYWSRLVELSISVPTPLHAALASALSSVVRTVPREVWAACQRRALTATVAVTVPSTVNEPALSSTLKTPVESLAIVTRMAVASVPLPTTESWALSTVREPALSSTETSPVESVATVTRSAVASVPVPVVLKGAGTLSTSTSPILALPATNAGNVASVTSLFVTRLTSNPSVLSAVSAVAEPSVATASFTIWTWPAAPASSVATLDPSGAEASVVVKVRPSAIGYAPGVKCSDSGSTRAPRGILTDFSSQSAPLPSAPQLPSAPSPPLAFGAVVARW